MRPGDLLALIAPQIHHAQPILLALQQFVQLGRRHAPAGMGLRRGLCRKPSKAVEQNALLRLIEASQRLGLGVDKRQLRRQLLEHGHGGRLVVHKNSSLARGKNLPAQNNLVPL